MEYELSEIKLENELTLDLELDILKIEPKLGEKNIVENGEYIPQDEGLDGYSKVNVNVPIPKLEESQRIEIVENGNYNVTPSGDYDAIKKVEVNVNIPEPKLGTKTITENGTYKAIDDNLDGYSEVNVETSGVDINEYYDLTKRTSGNYTYYIKKLPLIDTSDYTSFTQFCYGVRGLEEFPEIDTSNGQRFYHFIGDCPNIKRIPRFNFGKANDISSMLYHGYSPFNLDYMGGFENLGMAYNTSASENNNNYQLRIDFFKLTHESLMNVINNLYDIKTKGVKPQQLVLGTTNLAKLTAEEIAIATSKGWTVN